jgi:RNA-directed DNA polymerase
MLTLRAQGKIDSIPNPMSDNVTWNDLRWNDIQTNVRKVQHRIYKARLKNNFKQLHWLQKFLLNNLSGKLIAMRQAAILYKQNLVLENFEVSVISLDIYLKLSKDIPKKPKSREKESFSLVDRKTTSKYRDFSEEILNQATEILLSLALEPEIEALNRLTSSIHMPLNTHIEALNYLLHVLKHNPTTWVCTINIKDYVDNVDLESLLKNFDIAPIIKKQFRYWLKERDRRHKRDIENKSKTFLDNVKKQDDYVSKVFLKIFSYNLKYYITELSKSSFAYVEPLECILFSEELLLIHTDKYVLESYLKKIKEWFLKLELKTLPEEQHFTIKNVSNGFFFLGFQIIQLKSPRQENSVRIKIYPSRQSQEALLRKIRYVIQSNKSISSYDLIKILKPIILKWGDYFKYYDSKLIFQKLTHLIFQKIRAWVFRRDTKNSRHEIKEKYFPSGRTYKFNNTLHKSNWVLVGQKKDSKNQLKEIYLPHMSWIRRQKS